VDKECKQKSTAKLNIAILSHGAMGAAKDYSWLAYPLAVKVGLLLDWIILENHGAMVDRILTLHQ
jgi:hypothetical protein